MLFSVKFNSLCQILSLLFIIGNNCGYIPAWTSVGFFCNDTSIKEPFHGDSITATYLFGSLLLGGALIMFITDFYSYNVAQVSKFRCHLRYYYAGLLYVLLVTEILKSFFSELRPHFFQTCQPDINHQKCSNGLVTEFTCTGPGPRWLVERDIYKSFPSGHASLSFYTFVFLSLYIRDHPVKLCGIFSMLWKLFIPFLCLTWSVICCISRLLDHRHFWWDILSGIVVGFLGALLTMNILRRNFASGQLHKTS